MIFRALSLVALSLMTNPVMAQTAAPEVAAPDPARTAAAERAVAVLVPKGIYLRMMRDQFPKMMDAMMARMGGMTPAEMGVPGADGDHKTMNEAMAAKDPAFQQRMHIMTQVMSEEMGKIFDKMEPRVRAGLGRAFARKFTLQQLGDMNAFFATPSGAVFADQYMLTFMDPEMMQEMTAFMPEMMKAMPEIMKKAQAATAELPPLPKPEGAGK